MAVPLMSAVVEEAKSDLLKSNPNAKIKPVTEGNLTGYVVEINYENLEQFKADNAQLYNAVPGKAQGIQKFDGWFYDDYTFDLVFDAKEFRDNEEYDMATKAMAQAMLSNVKIDFVLNLPYAADENNADSVTNEGHTLTWYVAPNLISGQDKYVKANFKVYHLGEIIVTVVVLILVSGIIFNLVQTKNYEQ